MSESRPKTMGTYGGGFSQPPSSPSSLPSSTSGGLPKVAAPVAPVTAPPADLSPVDLVDQATDEQIKKIRPLGADALKAHEWTRQPLRTGTGAVRVHSFHGRLSDQGMEFLDNSINEWLEAHPEIEVKFVTSSIGMYEGKLMREPALILNVWY